jgi:hypothetical protein
MPIAKARPPIRRPQERAFSIWGTLMTFFRSNGFTAPSPQGRGRLVRFVPNSTAATSKLPKLPIYPKVNLCTQELKFTWAGYSSQLFYFFNLLFYCCDFPSRNTFSIVAFPGGSLPEQSPRRYRKASEDRERGWYGYLYEKTTSPRD